MEKKEDNSKSSEDLKELVRRYRICYEVWPDYEMVESQKRQIGLALELSGTHEPDIVDPEAGCIHCRKIFVAMREIAEAILPPEGRPSRYEMDPYDQSIHHSHARGDRPDVSLTVRIFHREDFHKPLDDCQERCLSEMLQNLKNLGASEIRWRNDPGRVGG
jgi:hypothetical protein